jgi:glycosyltransferase involved in cell wall biosynthesis
MNKVSIVVPTYGRIENIKKLTNSLINSKISKDNYELVVVSSDDVTSEKIIWLKNQKNIDINLILEDDRIVNDSLNFRKKSLNYYENIGIKNSKNDWILVCNDDMWMESDWYEKFLICLNKDNKVYLISSHIGKKSLGLRIPTIGTLNKNNVQEPLWLFDMTIIHKSIYEKINFLDENIGWYGKGADLSIAVSFLTNEIPIPCYDVKVHHDLENENRSSNINNSMLSNSNQNDFEYIRKKWDKWILDNNKNYSYIWL